jgi:hypothetical protein
MQNGWNNAKVGLATGAVDGFISGLQRARAENVNPITGKSLDSNNKPLVVTPEGVVLSRDDKYTIPSDYIEAPYSEKMPNGTAYGKYDANGNFQELIRIDRGTYPGYKGPNNSHYHLNNGRKHYFPGKNDPGFRIKF